MARQSKTDELKAGEEQEAEYSRHVVGTSPRPRPLGKVGDLKHEDRGKGNDPAEGHPEIEGPAGQGPETETRAPTSDKQASGEKRQEQAG